MKKWALLISSILLISCCSRFSVMKSGPLIVTTYPKVLVLNGFSGAVPARYEFYNNSGEKLTLSASSEYFASSDGEWKSEPNGLVGHSAAVNPDEKLIVDGLFLIPFDTVYQMYQAGKLPNGELQYVQEFNYRNGSQDAVLTVKWKVKLNVPAGDIVLFETNTMHFDVLAESSYFKTAPSMESMRTFLGFCDQVYSGMEKVLGYQPMDGKKISLTVTEWAGFPYFTDHHPTSPYLSIPASLIIDKNPWLNVVLPHELCHFFLLTEFPNPPRWMSEGPASFFAGKVCAKLGYRESANEDSAKISAWGDQYQENGQNYLFTSSWPSDNPGDHPLGFGRAFQLMGDIEKLCGADIFAKLFAAWKKDGFSFPPEKNDADKTALVIDSLEKLSGKDVKGLFVSYGYPSK